MNTALSPTIKKNKGGLSVLPETKRPRRGWGDGFLGGDFGGG